MPETIVGGVRELNEALKKLAKAVSGPDLLKALMKGGLVVERYAKLNVKAQHLIDTGNLRNSITAEPLGDNSVVIGPGNVVYAAIHEFGGEIWPRNANYLSIPVTQEARETGSPRRWSGELQFIPTARGGVLVDANDEVQYALVNVVRIPARPYMRPALDEHVDEVEEAIAEALRVLIEKAAG